MTATKTCESCGREAAVSESGLCDECRTDWERSRIRWRRGPRRPSALTWGRMVSGDAFVAKAATYVEFTDDTRILEVGPGYGRLLQALLDRDVAFGHYCGLDISADNCAALRERFALPHVTFVQGDVETVSFDTPWDVVLSSLTFKHLFPSFEPALRNLGAYLAPGARLCIDFLEGSRRGFNHRTYLRRYTREEILEILDQVGLAHVAFDEVEHEPGWSRLLTVAEKPR